MKITETLKPNHLTCSLSGQNKTELLNNLIDLLKGDERVTNIEAVRKAVLDREKIMSTGVGKGFAIPHAKTNHVKDIIAAFGVAPQPVDFDALDGGPVNLFFLLIGQEHKVGAHIKLLSRISRMMNNDSFRKKLTEAKSCEEIYKYFQEEEEKYTES